MNALHPRAFRIALLAAFIFGVSVPAPAAMAQNTPAADAAEPTLAAARDKLRRKEFAAALALFASAAQAGSAEGQYQYAQMLRNAQGTQAGADLKGACGWLEKAALQGHARAGLALAGLLDEAQCQSTRPFARRWLFVQRWPVTLPRCKRC
jgi:TPR repeat protein